MTKFEKSWGIHTGEGLAWKQPKPIWLFSSQTLSRMDTPTILKFSHYSPTCLWRWNRVFRNVAYKIQTPWNYPEENIQHTEHGESLKSRTDSMDRSHSWEAICSSAGQGILHIWSNSQLHCRLHKTSPLSTTLNQIQSITPTQFM